MKATLLLRSLLVQPITLKGFFQKLVNGLKIIGVEESMFTLMDEPALLDGSERMFAPESQRIVMVQNPSDELVFELNEAPVLHSKHSLEDLGTREHIRHVFPGEVWSTYILSHDSLQYGSWSVELELSDVMFYYTVSLEIGSALRYLFLALEQERTQKKLKEQNAILDYSASHDELTGLYNRVGGMKQIFEYVDRNQDHKRFIAVMADLDHLKQINDTFGHDEGDYAIKAAADILKLAMPEGAPLGRTGGDEYAGIFTEEPSFSEASFKQKVAALCKEENMRNGKKYYVNLSVGCHTFDPAETTDTVACLKQADMDLYEAKKKRRASVVKA